MPWVSPAVVSSLRASAIEHTAMYELTATDAVPSCLGFHRHEESATVDETTQEKVGMLRNSPVKLIYLQCTTIPQRVPDSSFVLKQCKTSRPVLQGSVTYRLMDGYADLFVRGRHSKTPGPILLESNRRTIKVLPAWERVALLLALLRQTILLPIFGSRRVISDKNLKNTLMITFFLDKCACVCQGYCPFVMGGAEHKKRKQQQQYNRLQKYSQTSILVCVLIFTHFLFVGRQTQRCKNGKATTLARPIIPRQTDMPPIWVKGDLGSKMLEEEKGHISFVSNVLCGVWRECCQGTKLNRPSRITPRPPRAERAVSLLVGLEAGTTYYVVNLRSTCRSGKLASL